MNAQSVIAISVGLCSVTVAMSAVAPHKDWTNSLVPQGQAGPEITLADGGEALYDIVLASKPSSQENKAAADLARWLKAMTGAKFSVVHEGVRHKPTGKEISVGRTALLRDAKLPEADKDLQNEGYAIAAKGRTLFLLGGRTRGIINAVYSLLEEDLGCRWYVRDTETIPSRPKLTFRPVPRTFLPVLVDRRDPSYAMAHQIDWSLRNRTITHSASVRKQWGGYPRSAGGFIHTYNALIAPSEFAKHPDWFSLIGGKRTARQLCPSNPELVARVIEVVLGQLKAAPDATIVDVSPNDGGGACQCNLCKPLNDREGTEMAALLNLVNAVADAVKDDYPAVRVTTLAYLNTVLPPKTIKARENVLIWMCNDAHNWRYLLLYVWESEKFQNALKAWHRMGAKMIIWDYPIDYHNYIIPLPNMAVVTENMRFYVKHGATGIFLQAQHYPTHGVDRSLMRSWVWSKQLWDLSRDTKALIRDFNYGFYGKAAEPMQQYDDMLWGIWERLHADPKKLYELHKKFGPGASGAYLTPQFIGKAMKIFGRAEQLAGDDKELLSRIELAELPVLYLRAKRGPGNDVKAYLKMIDKFERVAKEHKATSIKSGIRGPFRDEIIKGWRQRAKP